jgi:hypothetical protein
VSGVERKSNSAWSINGSPSSERAIAPDELCPKNLLKHVKLKL